MAFEPLEFTKNWENPEDFPAYEPDESKVRADLQWLHNELRDGLNRLIAALNDPGAAAQLPFRPGGGLKSENLQDAVDEVYAATREAAAGLLVDGTVTKQKLAESLLERIYGGKVWVALDTPGPAQNPDTDFPVGQLWLRPEVWVENLAADHWELNGCTAQAQEDDWILTSDGSLDTVMAVQHLEGIGLAGQKVWVHLRTAELDDHLSELVLCLNDMEHDLMEGGGVFEAELDRNGGLELAVWGSWPYAETDASLRLVGLTVVNSDAVDNANGGCLPMRDWPGFLQANAPFGQLLLPRILYMQEAPGLWAAVSQKILPVIGGGTGLDRVERGQLLYGAGENTMAALDNPDQAGAMLTHDGVRPAWQTGEQVAEALGQLRLMTGTYVGNNAQRSVVLPVQPKLLHIFPESGISVSSATGGWSVAEGMPAVLADGAEAAQVRSASYTNDSGTYTGTWCAKVALSGKTLTFSKVDGHAAVLKADYMNRTGVTYRWTALY